MVNRLLDIAVFITGTAFFSTRLLATSLSDTFCVFLAALATFMIMRLFTLYIRGFYTKGFYSRACYLPLIANLVIIWSSSFPQTLNLNVVAWSIVTFGSLLLCFEGARFFRKRIML